MIYFANPTGDPVVHAAMAAGHLGFIDTPHQKNARPKGIAWCADNGCFGTPKTKAKQFSEAKWWSWLQANAHDAATCAFATAPDVVGDAYATLKRSVPWLPKIRQLGYPAAFVAQDGFDTITVPWDDFDVLFIGGTDDFKTGPEGRRAIAAGRGHGKWVHCGRVNGGRRYRMCHALGCDSVDGTYLRFGPSVLLPNILHWKQQAFSQHALFDLGGTA